MSLHNRWWRRLRDRERKRAPANRRRRFERSRWFEPLEQRMMLNAAPIAKPDPLYDTPVDTQLVVGTSDTRVLDNDWDPESSSLTATLVGNPTNGTLNTFNSDGTFTYTPNMSYTGFDSFTYKANDGTDDSNVVTVSIGIGTNFGPLRIRMNSYVAET